MLNFLCFEIPSLKAAEDLAMAARKEAVDLLECHSNDPESIKKADGLWACVLGLNDAIAREKAKEEMDGQ